VPKRGQGVVPSATLSRPPLPAFLIAAAELPRGERSVCFSTSSTVEFDGRPAGDTIVLRRWNDVYPGEMLMPVEAVIFDLDGLMVDSEPLAKQAWRMLLARYGHTLDQEIINAMLGLRLADSSLLVTERFGLPLPASRIAAEEKHIFMGLLDGNLRPMPGLSDLLRAVDARGLPRAVATSSGRDYALIALRTVGVADGFAAIVTGDDVMHGKPAPDIYLAAAAELGRQAASCLALEDSPIGVSAAKAAGMRCVAVPNELTAELDLRMADRVFPSLMAVTDQLDNLLLPPPAL